MTRYLVTGGAGFIGSNFVDLVLESRPSAQITVLDNLSYAGQLANLEQACTNPRCTFVQGDIRDAELVEQLCKAADVCLNFAAHTHVDRSILDAADFASTNVLGTYTLLEAARRVGLKLYVQISTDEVYGSIEEGAFTETSPLQPSNPYSATKAGADHMVLAYHKTYGLPVLVTRCGNNYGPRQFPEKLIPFFITRAVQDLSLPVYGDGLNRRDWIHVQDHARAILHLCTAGTPGEVYNVSGNDELANLEVARALLALLGKPESLIEFVRDRPGHDRRYALDSGKLRATGWQPIHNDFSLGLKKTVEWYLQNSACWSELQRGADFKRYLSSSYASAP